MTPSKSKKALDKYTEEFQRYVYTATNQPRQSWAKAGPQGLSAPTSVANTSGWTMPIATAAQSPVAANEAVAKRAQTMKIMAAVADDQIQVAAGRIKNLKKLHSVKSDGFHMASISKIVEDTVGVINAQAKLLGVEAKFTDVEQVQPVIHEAVNSSWPTRPFRTLYGYADE